MKINIIRDCRVGDFIFTKGVQNVDDYYAEQIIGAGFGKVKEVKKPVEVKKEVKKVIKKTFKKSK